MRRPVEAVRAVYWFEDTLHRDGPRLLHDAAGAGFTAVVTEPVRQPDWLVPAAHAAGLDVLIAVACFSDHADPVLDAHPHLWPVDASGRRRAKQEWYTGLIPTDEAHNAAVVARCAAAAASGADGVIADFIRWPMHWELELRPGAERTESSFDATTLARFGEVVGARLPSDPARAAEVVKTRHAEAWHEFRRAVITDMTRRIGAAVRAVNPSAVVGAFIVPGTHHQRRTWLGQDVAAMAEHCDVLFPMTYHAILHRPPAWVSGVAADVAAHASGTPVVPVVQCTADPAFSAGADWGEEFDADEFAVALRHGMTGAGGVVVFCGEGLGQDRARALRTVFDEADRLAPSWKEAPPVPCSTTPSEEPA